MNPLTDEETKRFYDQFWHRNVPKLERTREYMINTLSSDRYTNALDAGCGHGVCSIVLAEISDSVMAVDISPKCIDTAIQQSRFFKKSNIRYQVQDLQHLQLDGEKFDLVWCWGVAMMAPNPLLVIDNLINHTALDGELYLGLYLKTWLSPIHEFVRKFCRTFMNTPSRKDFVLNFFAMLTRLVSSLRGQEINLRDDNISIQTQVEDWYYPPYKTFYSIDFVIRYLEERGMYAECIQDRVGRLKSATIFVVKARKGT